MTGTHVINRYRCNDNTVVLHIQSVFNTLNGGSSMTVKLVGSTSGSVSLQAPASTSGGAHTES